MNNFHQITITEQLTPGHERFANDEVQKDVGVCVKKKGFPIKISTEDKKLDFSKVSFLVSLLYDNKAHSVVDFIEQVPLTFKTKLSKDKKSATLEVSVLVLSSQYENSLFLIKIRAENKKNPLEFSECFSSPIKVVSKVSQLQTKAKKRTRNRSTPTKDMFVQSMELLDKGQEEHSLLLANLVEQSKQQTQVLQFLIEEEFTKMHESMMSEDDEPEQQSSKKRKLDTIDFKQEKEEEQHLQLHLPSFESSQEWEVDFNMAFSNLIDSLNEPQQDSSCPSSFQQNPSESIFSFEEDAILESPTHEMLMHENISQFSFPMAPTSGVLEASMDFGFIPNLFENQYLFNQNL